MNNSFRKPRKLWPMILACILAGMLTGYPQGGVQASQAREPVPTGNSPTPAVTCEASSYAGQKHKVAAKQAFKEGMAFLQEYEEGNAFANENAEAKFSHAIELEPGYAEAYLYRGYLEFTHDHPVNPNAELEDAEKALEINPSYGEAYLLRADIYQRRGLESRWLADLDKAIACNPLLLPARYTRVMYYIGKGDWAKATSDLEMVSGLMIGHIAEPDADRIYRDLSPAYRLSRKEAYVFYANYADHLAAQHNCGMALYNYIGAIQVMPDASVMYFGRGRCYSEDKNFIGSMLDDFNKAIELDPGFLVKLRADLPRLRELLAQLNAKTDERYARLKTLIAGVEQSRAEVLSANQAALEDYEHGLDYLRKFDGLGMIDASLLPELTNAELAFAAAIRKDPEFAAAYLQIARVEGDSNHIIQDLNKAIELKPDYAEAYVERANWFLLLKDESGNIFHPVHATPEEKKQGIMDLGKALELKPNYYYALLVRAKVAMKAQKMDNALADLNQAILSLPPQVSQLQVYQAYFLRGKVLLAKGMYREMIADLNQALAAANQFNPLIVPEMKNELYAPLHEALNELQPGELRTQFEALMAEIDKGVVLDWGPSK